MRFNKYLILLFISIQIITVNRLFGQDSLRKENLSISLDEIKLDTLLDKNKFTVKVTVATKTSVDVENTPGSVTVITRDHILATRARNLRQILNIYVPSMDVLPTGFSHGIPINDVVYSRGNRSDFSQQVLILFNGTVKYNESTLGSYYAVGEYTLENVERIEVSTTPTTIYGANAVTVINIVTYEQFLDGAEASLAAGLNMRGKDDTFQSQRYTVLWGNTIKKIHLGASLQYFRDAGQAHNIDGYKGNYSFSDKSLRDGTKSAANLTLHIKDIGERFEGGINYRFSNKDAFLTGLTPSQSNNLYGFHGQQLLSYFKYNGKSFDFNTGFLISEFSSIFEQPILYQQDLRIAPVENKFSNYNIFAEGSWNRKLEWWGKHEIVVGIRGERDGQFAANQSIWSQNGMIEMENAELSPNMSRIIASIFAEDNWKVSAKTAILLGARSDYFFGFGDNRTLAFNPRLSVVQHVGQSLILKAIVARTFRAPTIYELYGRGIPGLMGNKDIQAEKITSFEFNMLFKKDLFNFSVTPFYQIFESSIQYIASPEIGPYTMAVNVNQRAVSGIELTTRLYFNEERSSYAFINGSYLIPNDPDEFYYVPRMYAGGGFNLNTGRWNFNFTTYMRGDRKLPPNLILNKEYSQAQLFANLSINFQAGKSFNAFIMADQLAPKQYAIPLAVDGLVQPFRSPMIVIGVNVTPF